MPYDPVRVAQVCRAVGARRSGRSQLRRRSRRVLPAVLAHGDVADAHAVFEGDLTIPALEGAGEVVGDVLRNEDRAIGLYVGHDIGLRQREALGLCLGRGEKRSHHEDGEDERQHHPRQFHIFTSGACLESSSAWK